jgi:hypothetical protein
MIASRFRPALLATLATPLLFSACAPVPQLGARPEVRAGESYAASQTLAPAATASAWPASNWWADYADPQLTALIEEGLKDSPDLAGAAARLRSAQAYAQQAGAARFPSVGLEASATEAKQSYNNGIPAAFVPQGWNDSGRIAASLSFDLDLWGKNRAALAAATSDAEAARISRSSPPTAGCRRTRCASAPRRRSWFPIASPQVSTPAPNRNRPMRRFPSPAPTSPRLTRRSV